MHLDQLADHLKISLNSSSAMSCSISRMPEHPQHGRTAPNTSAHAVSSPVAPPNCSRSFWPNARSGSSHRTRDINSLRWKEHYSTSLILGLKRVACIRNRACCTTACLSGGYPVGSDLRRPRAMKSDCGFWPYGAPEAISSRPESRERAGFGRITPWRRSISLLRRRRYQSDGTNPRELGRCLPRMLEARRCWRARVAHAKLSEYCSSCGWWSTWSHRG